MALLSLPTELVREAFKNLSPETGDLDWDAEVTWLLNLRLVCKQFDDLVI
ncbi:hypothetical protein AJ79_06807 [Helicocarpus griseus UAMH5409]|uniref:F-box domain-containing protein n=1 Tax=Helicocarpus griseus UAMH5409 TaxID=1447875 RepID=A0A2B7X9E6_9EURO|nr:hypothetical protein AJ79_06807 [Helicocarpus griseus UAMH5409]